MMSSAAPVASKVRFADYEVDLRAGRVFRNGRKVALREKSFQVLALLLAHPGEVVTREELRKRLWPDDVFVDFDNNLNITVARLRQALRDSSEHPRFVETIPKHGYRLLATVSSCGQEPRTGLDARARIVVLPFVCLSTDPAHEHFTDAVTDAMITALARVAPRDLAVIARTTAMCYRGVQKDVECIGRELRVAYVLEGGVRFSDGHAAVNIQLIRAGDQSHLFAQSYDAQLADVFQLPAGIAQTVAAHIPQAGGHSRRRADHHRANPTTTDDLVAYHFYLQGREQIQRCDGHPVSVIRQASEYIEHALQRDPGFALAYTAAAEVSWWEGYLGLGRPRDAFAKGTWAALRAIEIDPELAYTHALLGAFRGYLDYDWAEVRREMDLALHLDPECRDTRFHRAVDYLLPTGRVGEAIAEFEWLLESDPLSTYPRFWLALALYFARDYEAAARQCELLIELSPARHSELKRPLDLGHFGVGLVYQAQGRFEEALAEFRASVQLSEGALPGRLASLGATLGRTGNLVEATALLDRLLTEAETAYVPATTLAWICLGLGDVDRGLSWMERAVEEADPVVTGIAQYPPLEGLHAHPRFVRLLQRMKLDTPATAGAIVRRERSTPAPPR